MRISISIACVMLMVGCALGYPEGGTNATTAGVSGVAGGGAAVAPACDAATQVFPLLCGTSVCHAGAINGLDLISPGVEARLVDVPAAGVQCGPSRGLLVDSHDPERSLLLLKLSDAPPCGSPMPLGSGPSGLTRAQLDCIGAYVRGLAHP